MALYTVHLPGNRRDPQALEEAVLIREGFSWPAFIFSVFWLLWHRLWLGLLGFVAAGIVIGLIGKFAALPPGAIYGLDILLALALAFEACSLRLAQLAGKGFILAGAVSADNAEKAERKAFAVLGAAPFLAAPQSQHAVPAQRGNENGVIGLFPEPGR